MALVLGFGGLIFIGMLIVQGISMWSAQKNTRTLLASNASFAVLSLVRETRRRLEPVQDLTEYVAKLIDTGQIDLNDEQALTEAMLAAMAGTEQVFGMGFVQLGGTSVSVRRGGGLLPQTPVDPEALNAIREATGKYQTYWGQPFWLEAAKSALVTARMPIREGSRFRGMLVAGVTVRELSRFIARSGNIALADNRFILYGRDHVLAHRSMKDGVFARDNGLPLPRLNQVNDPILAEIWRTAGREKLFIDLDENTNGHALEVNGEFYVYLYRELAGFGPKPLIVGIFIGPEDGLDLEIRRLITAAIAGGVVIVLCVAAAVVLGRKISAPIRELATGSAAIADLDLENVQRLKPSRVRELNEASDAFNRMTLGLRSFETYVPRQLVRRLMDLDAPVESEQKSVTVMFTDIVGFSTLSELMPAAETAQMLNEHFSILVACIEDEGGTVDKYIGDSVMAFWEPDASGVHVDRALRAARKIREHVARDNDTRRRDGRVAPAVRIGIHTGDALVGNIGAPGRINYTLVGDTVNVAARLEQLSKEIGSEGDARILISGDTVALAADKSGMRNLGRYDVRRRDGDIDVWILE
ncbi:MAG: adenylate/guanylate cyclase domain-containing protein [Alphaproteobacteria bacterium]